MLVVETIVVRRAGWSPISMATYCFIELGGVKHRRRTTSAPAAALPSVDPLRLGHGARAHLETVVAERLELGVDRLAECHPEGERPLAGVLGRQGLEGRGERYNDLRRRIVHGPRHSFASRALALGESLPMIGRLLDHRHMETTARYAHLASELVRESAARIADSIASDIRYDHAVQA